MIFHPDFDKPGRDGIQEAKEFALQLIEGQKQMIAMAEQSGEKPENIEKVKRHTKAFSVVVRNIPKDLI